MATPFQEQPVPTIGAHAGGGLAGEGSLGQASTLPPTTLPPTTLPTPLFAFSPSALTVLNQASEPSHGLPSPTSILLTALVSGAQRGSVGGSMLQALAVRHAPPASSGEFIQLVAELNERMTLQSPDTAQQAGQRTEWLGHPGLLSLFERAAGYAAQTVGHPG
jgi:hypothetical protein